MKKIAILSCLKACQICTGASCLAAWSSRSRNFAPYAGQDAELVAFMHCNGCEKDPATDPGMQEKLERLAQIGVDRVHLGICTRTEQADRSRCPRIQKIVEQLEAQGVEIVEGTHYRKSRNYCNIKTACLRYAIQRCCCCIKKLNCYKKSDRPLYRRSVFFAP